MITYTTMLDIFGEAGRISSMEYIFWEMEERGVRIDAATYTSKMHSLAKAGDIEGAVKLWEEMRKMGCDRTVVSYSAFMKILFDHGRATEASAIYKEMIDVGLSPTCHTYTLLIQHLAGSGNSSIYPPMREEEIQLNVLSPWMPTYKEKFHSVLEFTWDVDFYREIRGCNWDHEFDERSWSGAWQSNTQHLRGEMLQVWRNICHVWSPQIHEEKFPCSSWWHRSCITSSPCFPGSPKNFEEFQWKWLSSSRSQPSSLFYWQLTWRSMLGWQPLHRFRHHDTPPLQLQLRGH